MKKILVVLAEGFEEIEALGSMDILRRAGFEVTGAGLTMREITGAHGIKIYTDTVLHDVLTQDFDMLLLPGGGEGTRNLALSTDVLRLIKSYAGKDKYIAAICAAPTILAKAGILKNVHVTSYPDTEKAFDPQYYKTDPVVTSGKIITSRGPGTVFGFALEIVKILAGEDEAAKLKTALVCQ